MKNCYVNDFTTSVKTYYKDLKKCNPISREEEKDLMHRAKNNDLNAKNKLLTSNLKFVFDVAKNYKGYGVPMEDLISEGNMGLIHAFDKFDENRNVKFISYAVSWIRWYIQDYIEKNHNTIDHEISEDEILNEKVTNNKIQDNEDEELIKSDVILGSEDDNFKKENALLIKNLLNKLDLRERFIIEKRFGLNGNKEMTLEEVGKLINLSSERVRQLSSKSLLKLRAEMLLI